MEKHKTRDEDFEIFINKEQVDVYLKSEHSLQAIKLLKSLEKSYYALSRTDCCCLRDHIFTIVHLANSCRSGVTAHLNIDDWGKRKEIGGGTKLQTWDHKTATGHGAANIWLSKEETLFLKTYIEKARVQLPPKDNNIFLSWNGKGLDSGSISKRLHLLWVKAGIIDKDVPRNLCANIIRRSVSSGLRESKCEYLQEVCDTMSHSSRTQEEHYWHRQKEVALLRGTNEMRKLF